MRSLYESILDSDASITKKTLDAAKTLIIDLNTNGTWVDTIRDKNHNKKYIKIVGNDRYYGTICVYHCECEYLDLHEVSPENSIKIVDSKIGNINNLKDTYPEMDINIDTASLKKSGVDLTPKDQAGKTMPI